ncbi:MAG: hypothetical protein HW403_329 [Dehalococcoidia bacterium]|nr:hypothetical protein [Dehalococcoidia bacterium]
MAVFLLVWGLGQAPGKTAVSLGLGAILQKDGLKVGYLRPRLNGVPSVEDAEGDASFAAQVLSLQEKSQDISPELGVMPPADGDETLRHRAESFAEGKDVVLVELPGDTSELAVSSLASAWDAKVLPVVRYYQGIEPGAVINSVGGVRERIAGVLLNRAPGRLMGVIASRIVGPLEDRGVPVFGVLPEDRNLYGFSVGELAKHLDGQFLCREDKADSLVEFLMLGGNPADPALEYFNPRPRKAVFCRADRPDIQLAALDTTVSCLVLTGTGQTQTSLVYRAEDEGVPLVTVPTDTMATIAALDGLFQRIRFRHPEKAPRIVELLSAHCRLEALKETLGLG